MLHIIDIELFTCIFCRFADDVYFTPPPHFDRALQIPLMVLSLYPFFPLKCRTISAGVLVSIRFLIATARNVFTVLHPVSRIMAATSCGVNSSERLPCDHSIDSPTLTPGASARVGVFD